MLHPFTEISVGEIIEAYIKDRENPLAHKPCAHPGSIRSHLRMPLETFGGCSIEEFWRNSDEIVADATTEWLDEELSPSTIRKRLNTLKSAFRLAIRKRLIRRDEEPFIVSPEGAPARTRFIDRDKEWPALQEAMAHDDTPPHLSLFVTLSLGGMQRCGANLALEWSMVDFDSNTIWFQRTGSARNKRRVNIPMGANLRSALLDAKQYAKSSHVIEWRGAGVGSVYQGFQGLVARAGLKDLRIHDMRRSAATWAFMDGVSLDVVASMLGDNIETVRKHYAQFLPNHLSAAAASIDRVMGGKEAA